MRHGELNVPLVQIAFNAEHIIQSDAIFGRDVADVEARRDSLIVRKPVTVVVHRAYQSLHLRRDDRDESLPIYSQNLAHEAEPGTALPGDGLLELREGHIQIEKGCLCQD